MLDFQPTAQPERTHVSLSWEARTKIEQATPRNESFLGTLRLKVEIKYGGSVGPDPATKFSQNEAAIFNDVSDILNRQTIPSILQSHGVNTSSFAHRDLGTRHESEYSSQHKVRASISGATLDIDLTFKMDVQADRQIRLGEGIFNSRASLAMSWARTINDALVAHFSPGERVSSNAESIAVSQAGTTKYALKQLRQVVPRSETGEV